MPLFFIACTCECLADVTYVYCSNPQTKDWEWLPDERQVQGKRKYLVYSFESELHIRLVFDIGIENHFYLTQLCRYYFPHLTTPQPANHWYSDWYTFAVEGKLMYGADETARKLNLSNKKHYEAFVQYITDLYVQMHPEDKEYQRTINRMFGGHAGAPPN